MVLAVLAPATPATCHLADEQPYLAVPTWTHTLSQCAWPESPFEDTHGFDAGQHIHCSNHMQAGIEGELVLVDSQSLHHNPTDSDQTFVLGLIPQ